MFCKKLIHCFSFAETEIMLFVGQMHIGKIISIAIPAIDFLQIQQIMFRHAVSPVAAITYH